MSRDNISLLREGFEALNSGDEERILAFAHPDFETVVPPELSAEGVAETLLGDDFADVGVELFLGGFDG